MSEAGTRKDELSVPLVEYVQAMREQLQGSPQLWNQVVMGRRMIRKQ